MSATNKWVQLSDLFQEKIHSPADTHPCAPIQTSKVNAKISIRDKCRVFQVERLQSIADCTKKKQRKNNNTNKPMRSVKFFGIYLIVYCWNIKSYNEYIYSV